MLNSEETIKSFNENGYCLVPRALDGTMSSIATLYTIFDERNNFTPEDNSQQVPGTHSRYADPLMESLLIHLQPVVEKATGLEIIPTYSYSRVYRAGDSLAPHTDRPACEISATLCLGYNYPVGELGSWPIFIGEPGSALGFAMAPGDMVIYKGTEMTHFRETFENVTDEEFHSQAFLHYVDKNGPYTEHKFDKRVSIGTNK